MPRIFKYGDIPNINFTPDKELNILIYRSPSYLIIYRSHILLKMVRFFWPTLYVQMLEAVGRRMTIGLCYANLLLKYSASNLTSTEALVYIGVYCVRKFSASSMFIASNAAVIS